MREFSIIWMILVAVAIAVFGIWLIVENPAHWIAATIMIVSAGGLFCLGIMLGKNNI